MQHHLGEEGTEQFTVETRINGETIKLQPIHDPFIYTTAGIHKGFKAALTALFKGVKVEVIVRGTEGAQRAIMTLDPYQLGKDTGEILETRRLARETGEQGGLIAANRYIIGE